MIESAKIKFKIKISPIMIKSIFTTTPHPSEESILELILV